MYGRAHGIVLWAFIVIGHQQDVFGIDLAYGPGAGFVFDVKTSGPATMCNAHPLTYSDILLIWSHGIHTTPSGTYACALAIVVEQDQTTLCESVIKCHVSDYDILFDGTYLCLVETVWCECGFHLTSLVLRFERARAAARPEAGCDWASTGGGVSNTVGLTLGVISSTVLRASRLLVCTSRFCAA